MSHDATKWAFDQPERFPDMKPNEWAVLLVLADCHNPVHGCFPSQAYICRRTNLTERAVRGQLAALRGRGLVSWEQAYDGGHRTANRYRLECEPDFEPDHQRPDERSEGRRATENPPDDGGAGPDLPANGAGCSAVENGPAKPANPDGSYRQNLPPTLEPVRSEPVTERECAQAREPSGVEGEQPSPGPRLERFRSNWPTTPADSFKRVETAWNGLTPEERRAGVAAIAHYLAHLRDVLKRKHICGGDIYLREKRWETLPEPEAEKPAAPQRASAAPWSRLWWAALLDAIGRGDARRIGRLIDWARQKLAFTFPEGETPPPTDHLHQMPTSAPGWPAWRAWFEMKGARLPDHLGRDFWVWLPAEWPPETPPEADPQRLDAMLRDFLGS